jgi:hypothetical protein
MTNMMQVVGSALQGILKLFVDDGVYAAVTIAWITVIVGFGSRSTGSHKLEGLLLALGLDLIFASSVILRMRTTVRNPPKH